MLEHPAVVDEDEFALGALDVVGLLLVDELHVLLEVGLAVGLVAADVAHVLQVVGLLVPAGNMLHACVGRRLATHPSTQDNYRISCDKGN